MFSPIIEINEFKNIFRKCAKICHEDVPKYTRNRFDSFEFGGQNLKPSSFKIPWRSRKNLLVRCKYGSLQDNLQTKKFCGDIALTNILLA